MIGYIIKRLLQSLITLFMIITIVFLLLRMMPEEGYFGDNYEKLDLNQRESILINMGLREPLHKQLLNFYLQLIKGDLGKSIIYRPKVDVLTIIKAKVPYSIKLGLIVLGISLIVGIPFGILMGMKPNGSWDKIGSLYIVLINTIPSALYYLFIQMNISAISEKLSNKYRFLKQLPILFSVDKKLSWILPIMSMSIGGIGFYAMWMRRYMVDELNKDYVKLARAKGLNKRNIMFKHVFRNAFVPMAQYIPSAILLTLAGSIYIESLYSIPGMGGLLVDAIQRQDNTLVQALVIIYASIGIFGLFLGDILMSLLDPRIKLERGGYD